MNRRMKSIRFRAGLLALLMAITALFAACTGTGGQTETGADTVTEAKTGTDSATESTGEAATAAPTEAPTEGETQPPAPAVLTVGPDTHVLVLSDYAAAWEKTAAEAIAAQLGLETVSDGAVPAGKSKLIVGWSRFNADMNADFDGVGRYGYVFTEKDGDILLGANAESGMSDALAAFRAALNGRELLLSAAVSAVKQEETQRYTLTGEWGDSVQYAYDMANQVTTAYENKGRTVWTLKNTNVTLTYELKKQHTFTDITTPDGIPYVQNTLDVYVQDADGGMHWNTENTQPGHCNTMQLGYYFYSAHILDEGFGKSLSKVNLAGLTMDRTLYMYSDKVNMVQHLVASTKDIRMLSYGMVMKVPVERVNKLVIKDASGLHDSLNGVDFDTVEYVGFDIDRAGVLGYILTLDDGCGTLTVTKDDGFYAVDQHIDCDPEAVIKSGSHIYFGQRIYTDTNHTFDTFVKEAEFERNPLDGIEITDAADGAAFIGYDGLKGAYEFRLRGSDFNKAYYKEPDRYYEMNAAITCDDEDRHIWVFTDCKAGGLECAALLDAEGSLVPIPLEVGKNFTGENEEATYFPGDPGFGTVFFPLSLKKGQTLPFTVLNLYQNWGKFPLKQLSSISFVAPYYHLSCGVTETNCIAPTYVFGKDFWTLPDFRAMSAPLWSNQPQHSSIGRLYVVQNNKINLENTQNTIDSYGPVYADITLDYTDTNGYMDVTYRHVEMPQTDENRTYYSLDITVKQELTVKNFADDFDLFTFDSRTPLFGKMGYLNENNEMTVDTLDLHTQYIGRIVKLGSECPYYDYYGLVSGGGIVNFALIVRDWDIVIGGKTYEGGFAVRDEYKSGLNYGHLTLDLGEVTLLPGDHIHVDYILLPWGSDGAENDDNVRKVREDSALNPLTVTASVGTVIADAYVPKVMMRDGCAEFLIEGSDNNNAVRVYGMTSSARPEIYEKDGDAWVPYETNNTDYDGGMVYYDGDGTYSFAFAYDMTGSTGRTFRVVQK